MRPGRKLKGQRGVQAMGCESARKPAAIAGEEGLVGGTEHIWKVSGDWSVAGHLVRGERCPWWLLLPALLAGLLSTLTLESNGSACTYQRKGKSE